MDASNMAAQIAQVAKLAKQVSMNKMDSQTYSFEYLGINNIKRRDIIDVFHKIKIILIMGPQNRAELIAKKCQHELKFRNYQKIGNSEFFSIYKIGDNILSCSHGMGMGSISIFLNELITLIKISKNNIENLNIIRVGSSGGIGVNSGTIIVSSQCLDAVSLKPEWNFISCGKNVKLQTNFNEHISKQLCIISKAKKLNVVVGKTVSTETYYEGQARLDGSICDYSENDKLKYLKELYNIGVKNFEMEGTVFSGICNANNIKCAMICVSYLNRLKEDTVSKSYTKNERDSWMDKLIDVIIQYIYQFILKYKS